MRGWIAAWKVDMYISALLRLHDGSKSQGVVSFSSPVPTVVLVSPGSIGCSTQCVIWQVDGSRNVAKSDPRQIVTAVIVIM